MSKKAGLISVVGVVCVGLFCLKASIYRTPQQHVSLIYSLGGAYEKLQTQYGLHFSNPLSTVETVYVGNKQREIEVQKYAKDGLLTIKFAINSRLNSDKVVEFLNTNKTNVEYYIKSVVAESTENVLTKYTVNDIMNNRQTINTEIKESIRQKFDDNDYVKITELIMVDIDFPDEVEHALKQRVLANQAEEAEKIKTSILKEQAKQVLETAKAEAESLRIKNEALKGNTDIVLLKFIEKWDGKLPDNIGNEVVKLLTNSR